MADTKNPVLQVKKKKDRKKEWLRSINQGNIKSDIKPVFLFLFWALYAILPLYNKISIKEAEKLGSKHLIINLTQRNDPRVLL